MKKNPKQTVEPYLPKSHQETHGPAPELGSKEEALEGRLSGRAHPAHAGLPWHERTRQYCLCWDRARRRHTGILTTYFYGFGPLWEHGDWPHFNRARRQADVLGAHYEDWVEVQFNRLCGPESFDPGPKAFHGPAAAKAYRTATGWLDPEMEQFIQGVTRLKEGK